MRLSCPIPQISIFSNIGDPCYTGSAIEAAYLNFPEHIRQKISAYQLPKDRRIRIISKMLVLELITLYDASARLSLHDLQYDSANKPYINHTLEISITHSDELAVCAGSESCRIGIDIEKVRAGIAIVDFKDYLSPLEYDFLLNSKDTTNDFFLLWTRKEALAKLLGTGIETNFQVLDVLKDTLIHNGIEYRFWGIDLHPDYCCSLVYEVVE